MNRATNAAVMRASNRKLILDLIRRNPISRVELAERVHLTRASITQIVEELIANGLVEEVAAEERGTIGRRRIQLALCHNARFVVGVNIRRGAFYTGIIDLYGDVLAENTIENSGKSAQQLLEEIARSVQAQKKALGISDDLIAGVGVSAPGPVNYTDGIILNTVNFNGWRGVPVASALSNTLGLPVFVEKDTNARALEEKYFGAGKNISSFLLLQIYEGVGSGVMINDRLYRGANGLGTEIGHTSVRYDGPVCMCGGRGCLENYLRDSELFRGSRWANWAQLSAERDTPEAQEIIERATEYISCALVNAINLFNLERVIITGGTANRYELLLDMLNSKVGARMFTRTPDRTQPIIRGSAFNPVRAGAMPALHTVFQDR